LIFFLISIAGNKILRTITNWTNGFCEGAFSYTGPFNQNTTYQNGVCSSAGSSGSQKYSCDTDPDYENWPGHALYDANAYTSCSPYYGPFVIYAQAPTCMQVGSSSTIWTCGTTTVTQYTYNPSTNCTSKPGTTYTANLYNLDSCISSSSQNSYYSCPLTILPGVAFLAIGNDALGKKVINKAFVGGIFSGILFVVFVLMLGLTTLFYYRRIYRPLKKLILELANNDESNRDSRQALENVGVGSLCSWLCSCGMINKEELKKLGE
jgi:hypothetical protein